MSDTTILGAAFALLAALLAALHIRNAWVTAMLGRLLVEAEAVVREVSQVYTDEIVKGRADGQLTDDEKRTARAMAVAALKRNLGWRGLQRVARVLGIRYDAIDAWLGSHVESAVNKIKKETP